jgi:hypothetical protein
MMGNSALYGRNPWIGNAHRLHDTYCPKTPHIYFTLDAHITIEYSQNFVRTDRKGNLQTGQCLGWLIRQTLEGGVLCKV